nr:unnamed protein product [Spirometra erinaceieuropaei]
MGIDWDKVLIGDGRHDVVGGCEVGGDGHLRRRRGVCDGGVGQDIFGSVLVAVTGRSKRQLSIEESQPSTIGEANQRRRRRKTGSACGRYLLAMGELEIEESQPRTFVEANQRRRRWKT